MSMGIDKARGILMDLIDVLGPQYSEALLTVLQDHSKMLTKRRVGFREQRILDYMTTVPGVPLAPIAVQQATGLEYSPAPAMANLAAKGLLTRLSAGALYTYTPENSEVEEPVSA
jgi:hypothetical protein